MKQKIRLLVFVLLIFCFAASAAAKDIEIRTGSITKIVIGNGTEAVTFENSNINVTGGDLEVRPGYRFIGNGSGLTDIVADTIADNAVTTSKIADGNVTTADIQDGAVTTAKIADGTINGSDFNTSSNLQVANLTLAQKITFALGEIIDNIVDGWIRITGGLNVTGNIEAGGNVTAGYFFGNGSGLTDIQADTIADDSITTTNIVNQTIVGADINESSNLIIRNLTVTGNASINRLNVTEYVTAGGNITAQGGKMAFGTGSIYDNGTAIIISG